MKDITPCLWFDSDAEEAVAFYLTVFPHSRILETSRYPASEHPEHRQRAGTVMTILFELGGKRFTALNGGPYFRFNEAVSFQVECETQEEIDSYWEKLSAGGDPAARQCGWVKDKFGLSWQIVPADMGRWFSHGPEESRARVMNALLGMEKLDIAALEAAAKQR